MEKEKQQNNKLKGGKTDIESYIQYAIIALLVVLVLYNLVKVTGSPTGSVIGIASASKIIPTGIPALYGKELGISYDDVSSNNPQLADATINKLSQYEESELNPELMKRYIKIAGSISCEYCCGAEAIIFSNGAAACGCAHSYAMRGLAKYLLINHAKHMSDDEILSELGKWKVLFFPGIHEQKAQVLEAQGVDSTNYINLASNLYRGIEQGKAQGGGMVGGC